VDDTYLCQTLKVNIVAVPPPTAQQRRSRGHSCSQLPRCPCTQHAPRGTVAAGCDLPPVSSGER
jgi:hypothetical protein